MQEVQALVASTFGPKNKLARNAAIFIIHKNTDYRLREIGEFFNLSPSAINDACRQFRKKMASNETMGRLVQRIEAHFFRG